MARATTTMERWPRNVLARSRQRWLRRAPDDDAPVVLRHSRIYILPTRRGAAMLGTLAVMLVASLNYGISLGFVVTFLLAGLAGAALLHTFRNLAGIELKPLGAGETFAGGRVAFALALDAGTEDRARIELAADGGVATRVDVAAGAIETLSIERDAVRRGRLPLGRVTLSSSFPLGLWRAWAYVHFPLEGIVFAAPEAGAPPLPPGIAGADASARGRSDDADLAGVRPFQHGDPLSRVAWKAVARGAGWYSKAFEGSGGGGAVALDWAALPASLDVETRIARLTAWALAAEHAARAFALALPGTRLPAAQGRDHRLAVLTALALFEPRGDGALMRAKGRA
ncbi:MAG TPA: DUF58 domain-containing protein [Casimicrobiaceae bacterium]|nr:DUF58 domain-containing protein [Casimicrobiaceae bacterium]